jgi:hypothetical protein
MAGPVAGRRVSGLEVGPLGAGRHAIDLAAGGRLLAGLYLVRLTQGTSLRVIRVMVVK